MTSRFPNAAEAKLVGIHAIVAVAAFALIALCVTGIAAFAGLLPESDRVASTVITTPIIDMQVDLRQNEPSSRIGPQPENGDAGISVE